MKIVCQSCGANYKIADEKVQGKKVFKIKCKKCGEDILVRGSEMDASAPVDEQRPMTMEAPAAVGGAGADPIWHAVVNGEQQGPYSVEQLRDLLAQGVIDTETYVWRDGFDGWLPLHGVDELSMLGGSMAPPADQPTSAMSAAGDLFGGGGDIGSSTVASEAPIAPMMAAPAPTPAPAMAASPVSAGSNAGLNASMSGLFGALDQGGVPQAVNVKVRPNKSGDLFAAETRQQEVSKPLFTEEKAAPAPQSTGEHATGQRNENSVLFSLATLQQLGSKDEKAPAAPSADASGLIDINKLSSALQTGPSTKKSSVDDILTVGTTGGLSSPLAAPVLKPVDVPVAPVAVAVEAAKPAGGNKNMTGAILGGALILVVGVVAAAFIVKSRGSETTPGPVALNNTTAAPTPTAGGPAAPTTPAPVAQPESVPTPAAPVAPSAATAPAGGGSDTSARSHHDRGHDDHGSSNSHAAPTPAAPTPAPTPTAAAAPTAAARPRPAAAGNIEDLMNQVAGANNRPAAGNSGGNNGGGTGGGALPEQPARGDVQAAMRAVGGAVRACGTGAGGMATVSVVFSSSGSVNTANVSPPFAGTPVGSCVARAVRAAHLPAFSRATFTVNYPFPLN